MLHAIVWILVLVLFAAWSVIAWAAHALAGWSGWSSGSLAGLSAWIAGWTLPSYLASWFPPAALDAAKQALTALAPVLERVLQIVPGVAAWLGPMIVILWGVGVLFLLLAGAASSLMLRWLGRRGARGG